MNFKYLLRETNNHSVFILNYHLIMCTWLQSYCLITTGGATVDIIKQYIQSQGEKDGKKEIK